MRKVQFSDRTLLELRKFDDALATLEESAAENETRQARDSLLLRYVYTFEMAWQAMRLVLADKGDMETPRVAFSTLETAFATNMIGDAALWKEIREARNAVVHAYDEDEAIALAAFVRSRALPELKKLAAELRASGT
jgi:nucleotidyltransferase substrate binding protein (TIGR01987 family)